MPGMRLNWRPTHLVVVDAHDVAPPICSDCEIKMQKHDGKSVIYDGGTIPMSLSNDHYYGHVNRYIVDKQVTWLECAASCMVWNTLVSLLLGNSIRSSHERHFRQPAGSNARQRQSVQFHDALGRHRKMLSSGMLACN